MKIPEEELQKVLERHRYTLGPKHGNGAYAGCFSVKRDVGDFVFACKAIYTPKTEISKTAVAKIQSYRDEMELLQEIYHPNIMKIYDFFAEDGFNNIILGYCPNGTLQDAIKANPEGMEHKKLYKYSNQLSSALKYLHSNHIAHHDIKPSNCLIDQNYRLLLSDFGLAHKYIEPISCLKRGTMMFLAPEVLLNPDYDPFKADVWSFGVTIYMLATGKLPFNINKNLKVLVEEQRNFHLRNIEGVDKRFVSIIGRCLKFNPNERPTMAEIEADLSCLNNPFKLTHRESSFRSGKDLFVFDQYPESHRKSSLRLLFVLHDIQRIQGRNVLCPSSLSIGHSIPFLPQVGTFNEVV